MPKPLFDNSDDEEKKVTFRSNNDYAKSYNTWRKKEELMRMKTKFGFDDDSDDEPSSCSDDDDEVLKMDEKMDLNFFKTLSSLKNKDPKIYDQNVRFFGDEVIKAPTKMKTKDKPIYIKDYERKMLLENGGVVSDDEEQQENPRAQSPTFVQQQENLKRNLKKALNSVDDEDDGEWGGMFQTRTKSKEEEEKDEVDYKKWLQGQSKISDNNDAAKDLKPLKDYWNNPELNEGEKFLKDYILNKRFMDNDDDSYIPTYDEVVHDSDKDLSEDDEQIRKQEEFEHKYNFRFEEPDNDFIKRYPRTVDNSVRREDDRRKTKRVEIKERKLMEKQKKMEELEHLKKMKRLEIEEKLKALKEITGNDDVPFNDDDLEGDFDPNAHDKRMQMVFNNDYYSVEDEEKPVFSDMDDELEIDQPFEPIDYASGELNENYDNEEAEAPHCEDANFNMDCDYQQKTAEEEIKENMKKQKWRRKRSHVSKALMKEKPTFDPEDQEYEEYFNEVES
ncbi:PREDICTED: protein KRI1 homolog [Nicrophorus vespilloides]|uniref:Protein KRI1 homolog n=1 Tax=Nicrophorus vespilloides TaxID=110193 RepID=A0ABM1MXH4_NICVS|nr:PREDICTED: protein KRI1 homolog [Nicrophorus vespilloides]